MASACVCSRIGHAPGDGFTAAGDADRTRKDRDTRPRLRDALAKYFATGSALPVFDWFMRAP